MNGPRHVGLAVDEPLLFQRLEMAHHAVGRADIEIVADFAHRRTVSAVADLIAKEFVDFLLPVGQYVEVAHGGSPDVMGRMLIPGYIYGCTQSRGFAQIYP